MKKIIETYRNIPGRHCGSVAMRNLLYFYYQLDLPEAVVFGLGAGLDLYMIDGKTPMISGRSASLEQDIAHNLGIDYSENFDPDNDHAWQAARAEVAEGNPVMLTGDIFYLDYRAFKYHFPAHRFVLVGFDDEKQEAYIMDRIKETPEACSYEALKQSRNPEAGFSTFNLWGRFKGSTTEHDLEEAVKRALKMCAGRMLGFEKNNSMLMQGLRMQFRFEEGIAGIKALTADMKKWSVSGTFKDICGFNARNIEKFGNGGGLFRRLYGEFLQWTNEHYPHLASSGLSELATRSADEWTALAVIFSKIADGDDPEKLLLSANECVVRIAGIEEELFSKIWRSV